MAVNYSLASAVSDAAAPHPPLLLLLHLAVSLAGS